MRAYTTIGWLLSSSALALVASAAPGRAAAPSQAPEAPMAQAILEAEDALRQQEREIAESRLRTALLEGWLLSGSLAVAEGRLDEAEASFQRALDSAAQTRRPELGLALLSLRAGHPEDAIRPLRRLVARYPQETELRRLMAQALIADGRAEEAVQELEETHAAFPDDGETTYALATGFLRLGKVERAEVLFEALADQRPMATTHVLIGRTYRDFRELERARRSLEAAITMDPAVRRGHYYLGMVSLLEKGLDALDEAIGHFRNEIEHWPDDPLSRLYLGMALAERRRCDEALPALEVAAASASTAGSAHRFLGRCHLIEHRDREAVEALRRALELARAGADTRELESIHYQLAVALRRLGDAEAQRHFEEARSLATELVGSGRDDLASFLADATVGESGLDHLTRPIESSALVQRLGDTERDDLRRWTRTALARTYLNLGTLQAQASELDRAADLFAAGSELDASLPGIHRSLATALFGAGRYSRAVAALSEALRREPGDLDLTRMLALSLVNLERYAEAGELLADDPGRRADPTLQYAYAVALARSEGNPGAPDAFRELLEAHPDWAELHVLLGQIHAREDDFPGAIESLTRALALRPDVAEANATLGEIYLRQGRLDEAEEALVAELRHHPTAVETRYRLAVTLDLNRKSEAAVEELQRLLRTRPGHIDARYLLGKIQLGLGSPHQAVAHLEAAAGLAPEDANIRYQLGQAYQRLGDTERAAREFETFRRLKQGRPEGSDS